MKDPVYLKIGIILRIPQFQRNVFVGPFKSQLSKCPIQENIRNLSVLGFLKF